MQCAELMYRRAPVMSQPDTVARPTKVGKETIHSGHFMVSDFEAEAQDDEDLVGVPVPDEERGLLTPAAPTLLPPVDGEARPPKNRAVQRVSLFIDSSLTKLFQCMTVAYRQKLTSPKWNRFKGIRLRWKDKIRLNNVIWRCWHMQFIRRQATMVCQFASPLDVDMHNKPEAVVLEGKYWKRKLGTVTAEYKKWRMFYKNKIMGWTAKDGVDMLGDIDMFEWQPNSNESGASMGSMMVDEDYMDLMSDTLFTTISQPFAFPNPREIARGAGLADFIQPGLVQLQPNLDDFMDTLEPLQSLHDLLYPKLASVPEESSAEDNLLRSVEPSSSAVYPNMSLDPSMQFSGKMYQPENSFPRQIRSVDHSQPQPSPQQRAPSQQQFLMYSTSPMLSNSSQESSPQHLNLLQDNMAPPPPLVPPPLMTQNPLLITDKPSTSSGEVFAMPHVNKMKRRSQSGSALLGNSVQRHNQSPQHQSTHQQLSLSSTGLNLATSSDPQLTVVTTSALLAHLLQPPCLTLAPSVTQCPPAFPHNKPILPLAPSLTTTVLVGPPLAPSKLLSKTQAPSSADLTPSRTQAPLRSLSPSGGSQGLPSSPGLISPQSPPKPIRAKSDQERRHYKEMRRVCHINAEQKRRCNIQNGFQMLHSLIPQLSQSPNSKLSKAALLQKGADYIKQVRQERSQLKDEVAGLRSEIDALNASISNVQALLPASGAPVSRQRTTRMREMFDDYVRVRTGQNWKFWVFSVLMQPLLTSYTAAVSTVSLDDMCRSVLLWVEQHCSLADLRPAVLNAMKNLCTSTDILTDPARLPEQAVQAVREPSQQPGSSVVLPGTYQLR